VGEMREIAATQADAGLPRALFDGFAAAYAALAETPLARRSPESIDAGLRLEELLDQLGAASHHGQPAPSASADAHLTSE
jgi:hypothetical protein